VLIPEANAKDLQDIPENVKNGLEIVAVRWIDKVLELALESHPVPLPDDDVAAAVSVPSGPAAQIQESVKH
jgi:ATP-dependent Lon protease